MSTATDGPLRKPPRSRRAQEHARGCDDGTAERAEQAEAQHGCWHDAEELRWAARQWAARLGVKLTRLQLRPMRSKWGSISTAGRLTLNTELVDIPKPLGEFVIVHELVHLLAPNHGRVFKSFMHAYLPDWQQRERELRRHAGSKGVASQRRGVRRRTSHTSDPS